MKLSQWSRSHFLFKYIFYYNNENNTRNMDLHIFIQQLFLLYSLEEYKRSTEIYIFLYVITVLAAILLECDTYAVFLVVL